MLSAIIYKYVSVFIDSKIHNEQINLNIPKKELTISLRITILIIAIVDTFFAYLYYYIITKYDLITENPIILDATNNAKQITENSSSNIFYNSIILLIGSVILAPIFEELLYRKYLFGRLFQKTNMYVAIIVSALVFAYSHHNDQAFVNYFWTGIILALAYVKSGRLYFSILYHSAINLGGMIHLLK